MKECFGKTVTSLDKARECQLCDDFELCSQVQWQDPDEYGSASKLADISTPAAFGSGVTADAGRKPLLARLTRRAG